MERVNGKAFYERGGSLDVEKAKRQIKGRKKANLKKLRKEKAISDEKKERTLRRINGRKQWQEKDFLLEIHDSADNLCSLLGEYSIGLKEFEIAKKNGCPKYDDRFKALRGYVLGLKQKEKFDKLKKKYKNNIVQGLKCNCCNTYNVAKVSNALIYGKQKYNNKEILLCFSCAAFVNISKTTDLSKAILVSREDRFSHSETY